MKNWSIIALNILMLEQGHARLVTIPTGQAEPVIASYVTDSDRELLCRKDFIKPKLSHVMDKRPEYFFKYDPNAKDSIFYISKNENYRYDMKTGQSTKMPGVVDFVPSPDGKFIATPGTIRGNDMYFYDMGKKLDEKSPSIHQDSELDGLYQSVGKLDKDTYRVLVDNNEIKISDYQLTETKTGRKLKATTKVTPICRNLMDEYDDKRLKLPLLSKDGKYLSALDVSDNKTKIFKINKNGSCEVVANLGFMAGKSDFSYDSKKIIFHVSLDQLSAAGSSFAGYAGGYGSVPSEYNIGIGVYNIQKKTIEQIIVPPADTNYYYPVFKPDGDEFLFLSQQKIGAGKTTEYRINAASLKSVALDHEKLQHADSTHCSSFDPAAPMDFLKSMHNLICNKSFMNPKMSGFIDLPMDYNECVHMVTTYYDKAKEEFEAKMESKINFDQQNILAACEQLKNEKPADKTEDKASKLSPSDVPQSCQKCHVGANFTDFSGGEKERGQRLIERIESKDRPMPPSFFKVTPEERAKIKQYLDKLKAIK